MKVSFNSFRWHETNTCEVDSPRGLEFRQVHFVVRCVVLWHTDVGDLLQGRHTLLRHDQLQSQRAHRYG